jgi:hypothetical protein
LVEQLVGALEVAAFLKPVRMLPGWWVLPIAAAAGPPLMLAKRAAGMS